jgi:TPP-dependent pyruvate/acetoin dehydrogenase alpha subunit
MCSQEDVDELLSRAEAEVQKAVAFAEAGTWEDRQDLATFVYSAGTA